MNDGSRAPVKEYNTPGRPPVVRPRDAASLILLRGEGKALEVLAGRRPRHARFMPGVYVFPGGAIDPPDRIPWSVEAGTETLGPEPPPPRPAAPPRNWGGAPVLIGPTPRVPSPAPPA